VAEHDLSLALGVDAELFRLDSVVRWLDAADGRLKRLAADRADAGESVGSDGSAGPAVVVLPRLRRKAGVRR
jgi:hypothetical protein